MGATFKDIRETFFIHKDCHERFLPLKHPGCRPLADLRIHMSGISDQRTGYEIMRLDPDFHVLCYTLSGRGIAWDGRRSEALTAGRLLIVPAHTACGYRLGGARWTMFWFHMDVAEPWGALAPGAWEVRPTFQEQALHPLLEGILAQAARAEPDAPALVRHYAEIAAALLRRELLAGAHPREREIRHRLDELWDRVNARLAHPWSVEELARALHLSPVQFHRHCVRHFGQAPMRRVARLRMDRAEALLRNTAFPLKQIAALVGYENVFAFSTAYKRHAGRSPAFCRRERPARA
ncbi:MAG: helix-turn-helix transcriptional regulator [Planctomycetota bacterium]|nr:helix-turn-helix transcriptional regulator [Planctomycetota bacterium]